LKGGVPSMRIFESAAAGAVIITEDSSFARRHFGESVLYVNQDANEADKAEQIIDHFEWIRAHPDEALTLAGQAHAIFNQHFSLETLLERLPNFLRQVKDTGCFVENSHRDAGPKVEVIVRIGGRGLSFIQRCLDSLASQNHVNLGLILVSYSDVSGVGDLLKRYEARFTSIKRIASEPTGFRSTSLWDGMHAVEGEYFCNLDDDDTIHKNHISSLVNLLNANRHFVVAYSGCIQIQDESGNYYEQVNFKGPIGLEIKENRRLCFFDPFNRNRMLHLENFVVSNAWLARRNVLEDGISEDPRLVVGEDVYLYQLFLHCGDFLFSWRATANWHWRSNSGDNSMISEMSHVECRERIKLRTQFFEHSQNSLTCFDVARPYVSYFRKNFPRAVGFLRFLGRWLVLTRQSLRRLR